jgi:hypothetical protein
MKGQTAIYSNHAMDGVCRAARREEMKARNKIVDGMRPCGTRRTHLIRHGSRALWSQGLDNLIALHVGAK